MVVSFIFLLLFCNIDKDNVWIICQIDFNTVFSCDDRFLNIYAVKIGIHELQLLMQLGRLLRMLST